MVRLFKDASKGLAVDRGTRPMPLAAYITTEWLLWRSIQCF